MLQKYLIVKFYFEIWNLELLRSSLQLEAFSKNSEVSIHKLELLKSYLEIIVSLVNSAGNEESFNFSSLL